MSHSYPAIRQLLEEWHRREGGFGPQDASAGDLPAGQRLQADRRGDAGHPGGPRRAPIGRMGRAVRRRTRVLPAPPRDVNAEEEGNRSIQGRLPMQQVSP